MIFLATNQRLREINRIIDDVQPRQNISTADPVGGDFSQIAVLNTISAQILFLHVRGGDLQHVPNPLGGVEPSPGVRRIFRRMRTAIQVDGNIDRTQPFSMKRGDLPRHGIDLFRDSQLRGTTIDVSKTVGAALPLRQRLHGCRPSLGASAGGVVHWNSQPVADIRVSNAVLVSVWSPLTRKIDLRKRWNPSKCHQGKDENSSNPLTAELVHL